LGFYPKNCAISRQTFYINFSASRCAGPILGSDFLRKFKVIVSPEISWHFSHLHVDLVGPLQYRNSFDYIFTIIDRMSKWMEAIPLSETFAAACAKALTFTWISHFGVPETITSDRGPTICTMLNILHKQTP
jgi:hypothetical protein